MNANQDANRKEAGDLLLEQGKLTEQQLEQVRRRQRRLNLPQHRAIVDLLLQPQTGPLLQLLTQILLPHPPTNPFHLTQPLELQTLPPHYPYLSV